MWIYDLMISDLLFSFVTGFCSFLIFRCVTHLYALLNIELNLEECDATGV